MRLPSLNDDEGGATTPLTFSVSLEGRELGRTRIDDCEKPVGMSFALGTPAAKLHLHFEVDRVFMLPPDVRELGFAIEEITVR